MAIHLIEKAREVAFRAHEGQFRWDKTPYIYHPLRVSEAFTNEEYVEKCVALMHDVLEDSDKYNYAEMVALFGSEIADALKMLCHEKGTSYEDYIENLRQNGTKVAISVKIADMVDNLRDLPPGHKNIDKYRKALIRLAL